MPRLVRPLALAALLLVAAAACGTSDQAPAAGSAPSSGSSTAAASPAASAASPKPTGLLAFSADRVGGGRVDGASYAGKPVALWFWAPG